MKKKVWSIAIVVFTLIVVSMFFLRAPNDGPEERGPTQVESERHQSQPSEETATTVIRTNADRGAENPKFVATPLADAPEENLAIEYPKFNVGGSGTRGAVRDSEGNVVFRATSESPAFGVSISPNEKLMWVDGGDRRSYIIDSNGKEIAEIPLKPSGKDMLIFGNWTWLDNKRLLGESGVQKFDENGRAIGCCQGHNVSESRFYVYDLSADELEEMQLPEALRRKVVSISRVLNSGEILMGHEGDEFGWYQVVEPGEEER